MSKETVLDILEDSIYPVSMRHKSAININQSGTLNTEKLDKEKKLFFKASTVHLVEELVKKVQHYPIDDISEVDFEIDVVVLKRKHYDKIKEFIEKLNE